LTSWLALVALVYAVPAGRAARTVAGGATGPSLVPALAATGAAELLWGAGVFAGLVVAG
jgi:1,4-dihydroxy-2-naphthoate octaprenyltransferase